MGDYMEAGGIGHPHADMNGTFSDFAPSDPQLADQHGAVTPNGVTPNGVRLLASRPRSTGRVGPTGVGQLARAGSAFAAATAAATAAASALQTGPGIHQADPRRMSPKRVQGSRSAAALATNGGAASSLVGQGMTSKGVAWWQQPRRMGSTLGSSGHDEAQPAQRMRQNAQQPGAGRVGARSASPVQRTGALRARQGAAAADSPSPSHTPARSVTGRNSPSRPGQRPAQSSPRGDSSNTTARDAQELAGALVEVAAALERRHPGSSYSGLLAASTAALAEAADLQFADQPSSVSGGGPGNGHDTPQAAALALLQLLADLEGRMDSVEQRTGMGADGLRLRMFRLEQGVSDLRAQTARRLDEAARETAANRRDAESARQEVLCLRQEVAGLSARLARLDGTASSPTKLETSMSLRT